MKLLMNGEHISVDLETLGELVEHYKLNPQLIVTEVDGVIIGQEERASMKLQKDMNIEIVHFVGGG